MKITALIIALFVGFSVYGQEPNVQTSSSKVKIGINFSPDITYRRLVVREAQFPSDHLIKELRDRNEVPTLGFTTGFNTLFNLSDRFELGSWLQYALKGYRTRIEMINVFTENDPRIVDGAVQVNSINKYEQLQIPLKLNYKIGEGRLKALPGVGVSGNYVFKMSSVIKGYDENGKKVMKYKGVYPYLHDHFSASMLISMGVDYELTNRATFRAEPVFRYDFTDRKFGPIEHHLWNAGINLGYYYSLK